MRRRQFGAGKIYLLLNLEKLSDCLGYVVMVFLRVELRVSDEVSCLTKSLLAVLQYVLDVRNVHTRTGF